MRQSLTIRLDHVILSAAKRAAEFHNRTLTNYIETLLKDDLSATAYPSDDALDLSQHNAWFTAYSLGYLSRRELEEKTGLWFGDILYALSQQKLSLPRVSSVSHLNARQAALHNRIFEGAT